jgi:ATP-dependent RNA helicase SUPV3L1/SUV3
MMGMQLRSHTSVIRAVLGPTNTGKTHLAIDRMLGHATGMIGFPLRLLARENYDRIVTLRGPGSVALITGEEKIVPARPRWFVCTVESMPLDLQVDFLAIDEIQLCGDPERGHVFTDRLLHARGREETMFLGSDTIRSLIRQLLPEVSFESRPRFSVLKYAGPKKLSRLPRRSAAIVFSGSDLYTLAEQFRRQRGGAAVVLGALSPRARNAQVAMYQAGEVEHLVATDAIGMGLNMDIDHVAFASLRKFDGRYLRELGPAEIGQIAGRAGRHMTDGTFGVTNGLGDLDPTIVDAVEEHQFEPLHAAYWRNRTLDFTSPSALLKSLEMAAPTRKLIRRHGADDHRVLTALAKDETVAGPANNPAAVRLLWEVCQIPDFRKVMAEQHTSLLRSIYMHLCRSEGLLPTDWVAAQIARLDDLNGEIDALTARIAHVRTWTYVSHRAEWLADAQHWQERTRAIEDRLSDALHDRLTQRFVDRRAAVLVHRRRDGSEVLSGVNKQGEVFVEGEIVGQLSGLSFTSDSSVKDATKMLRTAARRAAGDEVVRRVACLVDDGDDAFRLDKSARIQWRGDDIARLRQGDSILAPRVEPLGNELLETAQRERIRVRLQAWLDGYLRRRLSKLFRLQFADVGGAARGLVFQLVERLGAVPRTAVRALVGALDGRDRQVLSRLDLRLGVHTIFVASLLRPELIRLRELLWSVYFVSAKVVAPTTVDVSLDGAPALSMAQIDSQCLPYIGYRRFGAISLRVDHVEKVAALARKKAKQGPFLATPEIVAAAGCDKEDLVAVMAGLGFRATPEDMGVVFSLERRVKARRSTRATRKQNKLPADYTDSPFAKLRELDVIS